MRLLKRRRRRAGPHELAVIRALLGHGRRADALVAQVSTSAVVERTVNDDTCALTVAHVTEEDLLIDLDADVVGDWQPVLLEQPAGVAVEFRVILRRGGFFGRLEGRTAVGPAWPQRWEPDLESLRRVRALEISSIEGSCAALLRWAQIEEHDGPRSDVVRCGEPANASAIKEIEQREGASLPSDFVDLLRHANGLRTSQMLVFGTDDAFVTDLGAEPYWVLGVVGAAEAFVIASAHDPAPEYLLTTHDASAVSDADLLGDHAASLVRMALRSA